VPKSWISQTLIYLLLMIIVKLLTALIIQMDLWNDVTEMILSPFKNPKLEVIMVMLIIPFVVNMILFWVTDNFLMRNKKHFLGHHQLRQSTSGKRRRRRRGQSILEKVKVKYQSSSSGSNGLENQRAFKKCESESELLSSEDDPIIQIQDSSATNIQQRSNSVLS
jgi:STIMATE family